VKAPSRTVSAARRFAALSGLAVIVGLTALAAVFAAGSASGADPSPVHGYIVQLRLDPVVAYDGGVAGIPATKPGKGKKINPAASNVEKYSDHLEARHADVLAAVGGGQKLYDYVYTYNGFAARLTDDQAIKLESRKDVLSVTRDELQTADTSDTPTFLGLRDEGGLWDQLGGETAGDKDSAGPGENVVIGIVDSGVWPESRSFSDRDANGKLIYQQLPGWHGKCTPGEQFNASMCNQKLIGAQRFNAAWGGDAALEAQRPWEFMSPRDYNGHGSHTSSTAGGQNGVSTTGPASVFGPTTGMAPRARIATYKALWSTQDASVASGFTSDLVAAIDTAVADGVDVINYSISGTQTNFLDPVQVSFLFAADAGVFVSASAGNSGPTTSTVAHPGPWLTTVAAGTHNRSGEGSVTLGNGTTYNGASLATPVGPAPLIDSIAAGLPNGDNPATPDNEIALCFLGSLDPAKVAGKIVLCDRGVNARVDKSREVLNKGGVGMILVNVTPGSLNADFHFVPTVHLPDTNRAALKAYVATASPTATINQSTVVFNAPAPFTAAFSSRGPLTAGGGDLLKPDVIAPGQDVLASVAPPGNAGFDFNLYSGTSMSAPHVAGLAALLKDLRPSWSPMAIKSALMTSGSDVLDGPNTNPLVIFRQGAGHVRPNKAADPGLVYDHGFNDWLAFLCGTTTGVNPATCTALQGLGFSFDPSDLNVPSIAIGDLAGVQTVTRKVRNVGSSPATYNASVTGMAGITVNVSPASLTLNPGETKSFTVTFTRTTAALNAYTGGQLAWSDGTHIVRSPLVIRPVPLAAPAQVSGNGAPISYNVKFGYTGAFAATGRGLVPATTNTGTVADDPGDSFSPGGPGTVSFDVAVPAGTSYARFSLFNEFTDGADDLDLYVFRVSTNTQVGSSGGGQSQEEVNLVNPAADTYRVWVHGFATDGPDSNFTLFTWVLGTAASGNMTVTAPSSATLGATGTVNLTFSGLAPATKYLGSVAYSGIEGLPNPTIVRVDTP
jgi:subtilisin family serine protease